MIGNHSTKIIIQQVETLDYWLSFEYFETVNNENGFIHFLCPCKNEAIGLSVRWF